MTREQMIEKAKAICEAKYSDAIECGELGLKAMENRKIEQWCSICEAFAELFEENENVFFGF